MTLFIATLLTGILLLAFGAHFLWHGMRSAKSVQAFPRSQTAAYILLGSAAVWFLFKVTQLGPADFGQYRNLLFILFFVVAVVLSSLYLTFSQFVDWLPSYYSQQGRYSI